MIKGNSYTFSDNASLHSIILIHGLGCSRNYFNGLITSLGKDFNYLTVDLPGHGKNCRKKDFTINDVINSILLIVRNTIQKVNMIVAHSMGSIIAFELDKLVHAKRIVLLSGNLINEDFSWSSEIKEMEISYFNDYWTRFKNSYKTFLKFEVVRKDLDFNFFASDIQHTSSRQIWNWGRIIAAKSSSMNDYSGSFSKTTLIEYHDNKHLEKKLKFCKYHGIEFILVDNAGHFLHIERPEEIS